MTGPISSRVWEMPGILSLVYLTIVGSVITFGSYYWLLQHMEVGRINLIAYLTPVFALTIGAGFAGETVGPAILGGTALVLSGVFLAGRAGGKPWTRSQIPGQD